MKKIRENSHFEFVRDYLLKEYGNRIIQIDSDVRQITENYNSFNLCLCEVADPKYVKGDILEDGSKEK